MKCSVRVQYIFVLVLYLCLDLTKIGKKGCVMRFSGGNKKSLQICLALMGFPQFTIIDDVAKRVDLFSQRRALDFFLNFKSITNKTVILSMGDIMKYLAVCDSENSATSQSYITTLITKNGLDVQSKMPGWTIDAIEDGHIFRITNANANIRITEVFNQVEQLKLENFIKGYEIMQFNQASFMQNSGDTSTH